MRRAPARPVGAAVWLERLPPRCSSGAGCPGPSWPLSGCPRLGEPSSLLQTGTTGKPGYSLLGQPTLGRLFQGSQADLLCGSRILWTWALRLTSFAISQYYFRLTFDSAELQPGRQQESLPSQAI